MPIIVAKKTPEGVEQRQLHRQAFQKRAARLRFATKTFAELTPVEKDSLLQTVAEMLGLVKEVG